MDFGLVGKIIALVACLMCAFPFLIISKYEKFMLGWVVGIVLLGFDCSLGIYIVYRQYKKILGKYT